MCSAFQVPYSGYLFGAAQRSVVSLLRFAFVCQSGNFSEALVGVKPAVVTANSSSVCRGFFAGSIGCQGQPEKEKAGSFDFNVTFQEGHRHLPHLYSRSQRGCRPTWVRDRFTFHREANLCILPCHSLWTCTIITNQFLCSSP